jgi:hypothetical protein
VKVVVDYERLAFEGGAAGGDRKTGHQIVGRMQLWF